MSMYKGMLCLLTLMELLPEMCYSPISDSEKKQSVEKGVRIQERLKCGSPTLQPYEVSKLYYRLYGWVNTIPRFVVLPTCSAERGLCPEGHFCDVKFGFEEKQWIQVEYPNSKPVYRELAFMHHAQCECLSATVNHTLESDRMIERKKPKKTIPAASTLREEEDPATEVTTKNTELENSTLTDFGTSSARTSFGVLIPVFLDFLYISLTFILT